MNEHDDRWTASRDLPPRADDRRQRHRPAARPPGGNITGFTNLEVTLGGKWLELLSEIAPGLKRAAIIFNPDTALV